MATDGYPGDLGTYARTYPCGPKPSFSQFTYVRTFVTLWAEAVTLAIYVSWYNLGRVVLRFTCGSIAIHKEKYSKDKEHH